MMLRGQDGERGYAMAALLVALAIMAILMSIALPVWRHEARREKEAELVFRGEQYARAIALFKFKNANIPNAFPPSIDFLVQNRFLRKKYKDPMTKDGEFVLIGGGSQQPGVSRGVNRRRRSITQPGRGINRRSRRTQQPPQLANLARSQRLPGRHDWRAQQEHRDVDPHLSRRNALRPVAVHVQHRAATRRRHADGELARWRPRQQPREPEPPAAVQAAADATPEGGGRNPAGRTLADPTARAPTRAAPRWKLAARVPGRSRPQVSSVAVIVSERAAFGAPALYQSA